MQEATDEIIDLHDRYKDFVIKTQEETIPYIERNYRYSFNYFSINITMPGSLHTQDWNTSSGKFAQ